MPPPRSAVHIAPEGRLRLSRSPTAELAAAATRAQDKTDLKTADFIVVAVPAGTAALIDQAVASAVTAALDAAVPAA